MKTLFEVGEEVIICSKSHPDSNGEAVVLSIIKGGDSVMCEHCGTATRIKGHGYGYYLNVIPSSSCCKPWGEKALRKKHKGGDFSFNEMLNEIKSIEKISA